MKVLVVGGSGVAGQCAIRAVRQFDAQAEIWSSSSKAADVPGAHHTVHGVDLSKADGLKPLLALTEKFDYLFHTPAFGSVGAPVAQATKPEVESALQFCLEPMVALTQKLRPKMTVAYTAYYFKPHLLAFYGALAYVKYATEKLAVENPQQYKCLRIGSFVSKATRGIGLLLQRMSKTAPHLRPLMDEYAQSGMKFSDFFFKYIGEQEQMNVSRGGSYHMTTEDDIVAAHLHLLKGESAPIINVLGSDIWIDTALPELPVEMQRVRELLSY
ncbi:MAG: SDR family NAD(P)-dependent oxidoreductase [Spirochaetota bacterium]